MGRRRKRQRRLVNENLLKVIFSKEAEWRNLRYIVDHSVDASDETRYKLKLSEAIYMLLLKEAKHRNISALKVK